MASNKFGDILSGMLAGLGLPTSPSVRPPTLDKDPFFSGQRPPLVLGNRQPSFDLPNFNIAPPQGGIRLAAAGTTGTQAPTPTNPNPLDALQGQAGKRLIQFRRQFGRDPATDAELEFVTGESFKQQDSFGHPPKDFNPQFDQFFYE